MPKGKGNKLHVNGVYDRISTCNICGKQYGGKREKVSKLLQLHFKFVHNEVIPSKRDASSKVDVDISKTNLWDVYKKL